MRRPNRYKLFPDPTPYRSRSAQRSKESVQGLRAILSAVRKQDADAAERLTREEAGRAAEEVLRLLAG